MSQGRFFIGMIRVSAQKSELQAESRSYRPKVSGFKQADPQTSEPNGPAKGPEWSLGDSTENPP